MSGYSKERLEASYVTEPAVHKWKKASGVKKGKKHGRKKCDSQHYSQALDLPNIKISDVCSLSQNSSHYNTSVASWFIDGQHDPAHEKPADANDYKMLNELDVECICLDSDPSSTSSNESDHILREEGVRIAENVSTSKCKGKNPNKFLPSDLTEEGGLYETPKLDCPTVSSLPVHADSVQVHVAEAVLSASKTEKALDVTQQTLRNLKSLMHTAGKPLTQLKQNKLKRSKMSSVVYPNDTEIEQLTLSEVQRKSSFTVRSRTVPSDNQPMHDPENNIGNKLLSKELCCAHSWSAFIYNKQFRCSCSFPVGSTKPGLDNMAGPSSVSQVTLEQTCGKYDVSLVNDLNTSTNTVQKGSALTQDKLGPSHKKKRETKPPTKDHIQNKHKRKTYILEKRSRTGRKSNEKNKHLEGKQESNVNSVLEIKTLEKQKSRKHSRKKAQPSHIWLREGKEEEKSKSMGCDMICISSNESDSDIMEVEVSVPENVRKDLDIEHVSRQVTLSSPVSKLENRKVDRYANVGKADLNKNLQNIDHLKPNSTTGAIQSGSATKVFDVVQHHRTLPRLQNDTENNSVQSQKSKYVGNEGGCSYVCPKHTITLTGPEPPQKNCQKESGATPSNSPRKVLNLTQGHRSLSRSRKKDSKNKVVQSDQSIFVMNAGGGSCAHSEQTDELMRESIVHIYQDSGPEPFIKKVRYKFKARDTALNDCQAATCINEVVVQDTQIEEQTTLHSENMFGLNGYKLLNESAEAEYTKGNISKTCNTFCSEVLIECPLSSNIEEIQEPSSASLDIITEPYNQGDQECQLNEKDQLSKLITYFPVGINNLHTQSISGVKKDAKINPKDYSREVSDNRDGVRDLIEQFDEEHKSLQHMNRSSDVLYEAKPSDHQSSEGKRQKDTSTKDWSAYMYGQQSKCLCISKSHKTYKPTGDTTQYTPGGRPKSAYKTMKTFASPKLNVSKSNICSKGGRGKKGCSNYEDNSQSHPTKEEQSLPTQINKKLYIKKDTCLSPQKTITSTTRNLGLDVCSMTGSSECLKDGGFSFKSDIVRSAGLDFKVSGQMPKEVDPTLLKKKPLPSDMTRPKKHKKRRSEQDFNIPGQMPKEVDPTHPKNKLLPSDMTRSKKRKKRRSEQDFNVPGQMPKVADPIHPKNKPPPSDLTRPKKRKRLIVAGARSTGACPEKCYSSFEPDILEQTISSQTMSQKFSSPATNKSESEMGLQNLQGQTKEVIGNRIRKSNRNTKRSIKKLSLTNDTRETFPELETNAGSQLRTIDAEQQLAKYNNTLVHTGIKNTSTMANQNTKDLSVQPAVQKLTEDTHQENKRRRKKHSHIKKQCIPTGGEKARSTSGESHILYQEEVPSDKMKATANSILTIVKNSTKKMGIKKHRKSMDVSRNYVEEITPATSDKEMKTAYGSHGGITNISTPKEKMCMKQCRLQLHRLAVPIQGQSLLGNMKEMGKDSKVEGNADTKNKEE